MQMTRLFASIRAVTLCLAPALVTMACVDESADLRDSPIGDIQQSQSPLLLSEGGKLWNDNNFGTGASVPVCFIARPILKVDGSEDCKPQNDNTDCNGESRAHQSESASIQSSIPTNNCLVRDASDTVVVTGCTDTSTKWRWVKWNSDRGALMADGTNPRTCLAVSGNGTANNTRIVLSDCSSTDGQPLESGQVWVRQGDGSLMNPNSGRCLDVPGSLLGTQMQIYDCNGTNAQLWTTKDPNEGKLFVKADMHKFVRDAIEDSYSRITNLHFTGWADCPIEPDGRHHEDQLQNRITVRFGQYPESWGGTWGGSGTRQINVLLQWDQFVDYGGVDNAIHEFGHALGFNHEWWRPDWPYRVCSQGGRFPSALPGNYCLQGSDTGAVTLKDCNSGPTEWSWDKWSEAYQSGEYFGSALKTNGESRKCLDVSGGATENGTLVQLWDCNQSDAQLWVPDADGSLRNPHSNRCLDVPGGNVNAPQLQIYDCNGTDSQHWLSGKGITFGTSPDPDSQWQYCVPIVARVKSGIPSGSYCLEVRQDNAVIIVDCNSNKDTRWHWEKWDNETYTGNESPEKHITGGALMAYKGDVATNRCLAVTGANTANGTKVQLGDCNQTLAQLWQPENDGSLKHIDSGRCLDVPNSTVGAQLEIYDCNGGVNQRWEVNGVGREGPPLSAWDIAGIHNAYGRKPAGTIVGLSGKCVTIPLPYTGKGELLQTYYCDGSSNQQWVRSSLFHMLAPTYADSYWDVVGGTLQDEAQVEIYSRNTPTTANQQWRFNKVAIRAIGDTCVEVPSNDFHNGAELTIEKCTKAAEQQWEVIPTGMVEGESTVAVKHGDYCWDVPYGQPNQGLPIQVYICNNNPSQRFTQTTKGQITFSANGVTQCVDVAGGAPELGQGLILYPCKNDDSDFGRENQLYYLSGPIEVGAGSGKCLDLPAGDAHDGATLQIYGCNGGDNQEWDYYFGPRVACTGAGDCDDGNPCTVDSCVSGYCRRSAAPSGTTCADDGNPCTDNICKGGVCTHPNNTAPCASDGNECTNDICSGGVCTHPNNTAPCASDGNSCTSDICSGGVCTHPNNGSCTPCSGLCSNPVNFTWSGSYQSGPLGTGAICRQTTQNLAGGNCGNFAGNRALYLNGTRMSCSGANWTSLPAKVNGGYCFSTTSGNYAWAYLTAW